MFLEKSTCRCIRAALVVALLMPGALLAVTAARQSRLMVVHVRDSSDRILEIFQSAAVAAGLRCHRLFDGWKKADVHCKPNADGNFGLVSARDVTETQSVVISAFSNNVSTPHGELDPAVAAALAGFRRALKGQPENTADR